MDYIGIFFLAIIGIYFISGFRKGFIVNLLQSIKTIGVFILAIVFCKQIGAYLLETGIGVSIIEKFDSVLLGLNEAFGTTVTVDNQQLLVENVWEYVPLPSSLHESCKNLVAVYIEEEMGLTIGYYISKALANYVTISIAFVLILLIGSIVFSIIIRIFKSLTKKQGFISRLLGGLVGIVRGLIIVSVFCYIISIVYSFGPSTSIGLFIENSLNHEVGIFRFFYEHNLVSYIINLVLGSI